MFLCEHLPTMNIETSYCAIVISYLLFAKNDFLDFLSLKGNNVLLPLWTLIFLQERSLSGTPDLEELNADIFKLNVKFR